MKRINYKELHKGILYLKNKMLKRRKLLKKLGFKNAAQYMAWQVDSAGINCHIDAHDTARTTSE